MNNNLNKLGFTPSKEIYSNLTPAQLIEEALLRNESILSDSGALLIDTGKCTGRSANDKYVIFHEEIKDEIAWGPINQKLSMNDYEVIRKDIISHLNQKDLFIFDGFAVADPAYQKSIRVICSFATQSLFIRNMLIRSNKTKEHADINIIVAPDFHLDPTLYHTNSDVGIFMDIQHNEILICGTMYCGEIKKSVFAMLNYLLPKVNVLPMHCSANVGKDGDTAIFFGLSGTGKTTLSTDPNRRMIGDDEHGWSDKGIFNIEGGIYAKCANLKREHEPAIYDSIRFGAVLENVTINQQRVLNFFDLSKTENSRVCFPIDFLNNIEPSFTGSHPNNIIFLTADAFGVLPPVSKLTKEQAMYHFISGYTSKLAGTESGITTPTATFSACFGEPFLPLPPIRYAQILGEKLDMYNSNVYLVNTGWIKGEYGVGERIPLQTTRNIINAILSNELSSVEYNNDNIFGLYIPLTCPNVDSFILSPKNSWNNPNAYGQAAKDLAKLFHKNSIKFDLDQNILNAGPKQY